jgi:hypothetical protein
VVLDQARLALVQCERGALADRGREVLGRQVLVVEGVAELVQGREQPAQRVHGVEPGGEPDVARADPDGGRVGGLVEPAAGKVEPEAGEEPGEQVALRRLRHRPADQVGRARAPGGAVGQLDQASPQRQQQAVERGRGQPGLPVIEAGVVPAAGAAQAVGVRAGEHHDPLEEHEVAGRVAGRAGLLPGALRPGRLARQVLDERYRGQARAVVLAAKLAQVGGRHRVGGAALRLGEEIGHARVGGSLVLEPGQERLLLGAHIDAAGRQVGLGVPVEQRGAGLEEGALAMKQEELAGCAFGGQRNRYHGTQT